MDILNGLESTWDGQLRRMNVSKHLIDVLSDKLRPVPYTFQRTRPMARQFVAVETSEMIAKNVVVPTTTEFAALIVSNLKKDGSLCFCVEDQKQNAETVRHWYPLPRMNKFIDSFGEMTVFSTLDASYEY